MRFLKVFFLVFICSFLWLLEVFLFLKAKQKHFQKPLNANALKSLPFAPFRAFAFNLLYAKKRESQKLKAYWVPLKLKEHFFSLAVALQRPAKDTNIKLARVQRSTCCKAFMLAEPCKL
jgi:hypothetical protein